MKKEKKKKNKKVETSTPVVTTTTAQATTTTTVQSTTSRPVPATPIRESSERTPCSAEVMFELLKCLDSSLLVELLQV